MALFLIIIIGGWAVYEALKHYGAEKYAQKRVHDKNINFFSFTLSNHPFALIWIVFAVILFVALCVSST